MAIQHVYQPSSLSIAHLAQNPTPWSNQFTFRGKTLHYNRIAYNNRAERTVEVPLAFDFLARHQYAGPVLEVGNVLQHYENALSDVYGLRSRCIVDKFEVGYGIENSDLMDLDSEEKFPVVVCVSTAEHVGQSVSPTGLFGERSKGSDREAPLKAIAKIYDLLAPGGHALLTVPFGTLTDGGWYIQFSLDYLGLLVTRYGLPEEALSIGFLRCISQEKKRNNPAQVWVEADGEDLDDVRYDTMRGGSRAIAVIELTKCARPFTLALDVPPTPLKYRQSALMKHLLFVTGAILRK